MSAVHEAELADTLEAVRGPSKLTLGRVAEIRDETYRRVRAACCDESIIENLDEYAAAITLVVKRARP